MAFKARKIEVISLGMIRSLFNKIISICNKQKMLPWYSGKIKILLEFRGHSSILSKAFSPPSPKLPNLNPVLLIRMCNSLLTHLENLKVSQRIWFFCGPAKRIQIHCKKNTAV
jgi:hypothetical protein